ncbi:MAG: hypothetical protein IT236_17050 [Bacteroidia bacterium]|nr:hypothetical protein [Bacteroidia bacterium]
MNRITKLFATVFVVFIFCGLKNENTSALGLDRYTNPFDTLKYDKAIAYDFKGEGENEIVSGNNRLIESRKILKQSELSGIQVKRLNAILGDKKSYGGITAACFEPHLGIVFYKKGKIVGHISICLACNYHQSKPFIAAQHTHKTDLCKTCYAIGYSKKARILLSEFVKELKFSHWQLKSNLFDK